MSEVAPAPPPDPAQRRVRRSVGDLLDEIAGQTSEIEQLKAEVQRLRG